MKLRQTVSALVVLGAVAALVSIAATASASNVRRGVIPQLTIGYSPQYSTLDPGHTAGCSSITCQLIFDKLMKIGTDGKLQPSLAASVSRPSPATYVYHLRHGVKFWDGTEMTSADVVNALNYERYPGLNSASGIPGVKSITAKDRYTIAVVLKHPNAGFQYQLAIQGPIFEKKFQDEHGATMGQPGTLIMGSGPWEITSFDPTSGMELTANPHYWGGPVAIQHVSVKFFTNPTSEALAMRAGAVDVAFVGSAKTFQATVGNAATVESFPSHYSIAVFAMNPAVAPFNDVHVRRAIAYAINRSDVISATGQYASPLYTSIIPTQALNQLGTPAQVAAVLKSVPQYRFDLAKAKAELAQSAYPNGFTVNIPTINAPSILNIFQAIAADVKNIGITLNPDVEPVTTWLSKVEGPKTYLGTFAPANWPSPDPDGFPSVLLSAPKGSPGALNLPGYISQQALIEQGDSTQDPAKRLQIYGQLLLKLQTDLPYIGLYLSYNSIALSTKFTGPQHSMIYENGGLWPLLIKPKG